MFEDIPLLVKAIIVVVVIVGLYLLKYYIESGVAVEETRVEETMEEVIMDPIKTEEVVVTKEDVDFISTPTFISWKPGFVFGLGDKGRVLS